MATGDGQFFATTYTAHTDNTHTHKRRHSVEVAVKKNRHAHSCLQKLIDIPLLLSSKDLIRQINKRTTMPPFLVSMYRQLLQKL